MPNQNEQQIIKITFATLRLDGQIEEHKFLQCICMYIYIDILYYIIKWYKSRARDIRSQSSPCRVLNRDSGHLPSPGTISHRKNCNGFHHFPSHNQALTGTLVPWKLVKSVKTDSYGAKIYKMPWTFSWPFGVSLLASAIPMTFRWSELRRRGALFVFVLGRPLLPQKGESCFKKRTKMDKRWTNSSSTWIPEVSIPDHTYRTWVSKVRNMFQTNSLRLASHLLDGVGP